MAIFITLHQKVRLHQGAIDIHFPDLGRWRSIMYPCPISQEYLWVPSTKTVRAAAVQALVAPGWKVCYWSLTMYYIVIHIFLTYGCRRILLPIRVIRHIVEKLSLAHQHFFRYPLLFRIPMGGKKKTNTHYHYIECWNLRCSTYIYGKEIWVWRRPVCWDVCNKASGRSAIT